MESLYVLIPIALLFVVIAVAVFFFAVRSDQFEDLERQGMNILLDDESTNKATTKSNQTDTDDSDQSNER